MKRISVGWMVIAGLLIVWGVTDLYHYATVGRDVLNRYADIPATQEMVRTQLIQGLVKSGLGIGCILTSCFAKTKKH